MSKMVFKRVPVTHYIGSHQKVYIEVARVELTEDTPMYEEPDPNWLYEEPPCRTSDRHALMEKLHVLEECIDERLYEKAVKGETEVVKLRCSKTLATFLEADGYTVRRKNGVYLISNE